jgi:uncharacterized protein (TIGR02453 family)
MPKDLQDTLDFLRDLRSNNNKQWFEQNRKRYEAARDHFETFISDLISNFGEVEKLTGVTAKDCIFRINRDVRFSPDKSPYKANMAAVIGQGGRKPTGRSYYVHLAPDGESMLAGGLHSPSSQELDKVRRRIAEDAAEFKKIIHKAEFTRYFGGLQGEQLKTAPQGYPKDHPDIELLRYKQFLAESTTGDAEVVAPDFNAHVLAVFKAMKPFVAYIQSALTG